jgi:adenylate cyclase
MPEPSTRRLAAIMFTDITGYTAMMQENEAAAAALRQRHRAVFQSEHERYHGEVLQYYGDGTLSVFKSAVEAAECAIAMQRCFHGAPPNGGGGHALPVPLRIGIHLGDIVFSENDVYGDGVNLAARIESLGVPGCILLSDKLNYAIKSQGTIATQSLGFFEFKNVREPVEVFAVTNTGIRVPDRSELHGKVKENKKSIAVLPFVNMSADAENEYFSDGIAEEILNALVKVEGLQVTARTSSFFFKGKNIDVREIGRQLGVAHLLEGSVRKAGNRVRITAQLVSSVDGYHFFSETYDRTLEDIFAVQDEIALKITHRLREHLGEAQQGQELVKPPTLNLAAYDTYLKGLYFFNQWGGQGMGKAIPFFEQAIELQSDFALPHIWLSMSHIFQAFGGQVSWKDAHARAKAHLNRVVEANSESPEFYFALFVYYCFSERDLKQAVAAVKKGLERYPNQASLHHAHASLYCIAGDHAAMIVAHKKGLQLDPLSMEMIFYMGVAYLWSGDGEQAAPYFEKVLDMVPQHRGALEYKGWMAAFQGKYREAIGLFEKLEPPAGYRLNRATCLAWTYFKMGDHEKADHYLQQLKTIEEQPDQAVGISFDLAILHTCFGNFDLAFQYLETAFKNQIGDALIFRSDPFLAPLRSDARIAKMEALLGEMPEIDF